MNDISSAASSRKSPCGRRAAKSGRELCSPGSHPHADQPNWRPAESYNEYLANCREGLETYSDRRVAKLLGMSRIAMWRGHLLAQLPNDLFEFILSEASRLRIKLSEKSLAQVALALRTGSNLAETERCPHCHAVLRLRAQVGGKLADVVNTWLAGQQRGAS